MVPPKKIAKPHFLKLKNNSDLTLPSVSETLKYSGQIRSGQVRLGQAGSGWVRLGQAESVWIRLGQVESGYVRQGQARSD